MASRRPSSARRAAARHLVHRANDVVLGHVGRVSYLPRDLHKRNDEDDEDDDGQGENNRGYVLGHLHINRMVDRTPRIEQVLPFDEWYAPSRADDAGGPPAGARALRSQQRWLFRSHPGAFLGLGGDLGSLLQEQTSAAAAAAPSQGADLLSSLLGAGEITDATRPTHPVGVPALVMVCGRAGDVVRVVRLRDAKRSWSREEGRDQTQGGGDRNDRGSTPAAALSVAVSDVGYEGFWDGEGVPVIKVQFVAVPKTQGGLRRWLLVQTAQATMVFQPEIRAVPTWSRASRRASDGGAGKGPCFIELIPALTIQSSQVGDGLNSDFSFDPGSEDDPRPRLAIVDRAGEWTVWNITGDRGSRHKPLSAMVVHSGYVHDGLPADRARLIVLGDEEEQCRISWAAARAGGATRKKQRDDSGLDLPALDGETTCSSPSRAEALVMSTPKTLKILDLEGGDNSAVFAELVDPKTPEAILDVCVCPGDLSRLFVLTSTAVFWIQLTRLRPGAKDVSDQQRDHGRRWPGHIAITILLSCPHLRSPVDSALRMTVAAQPQQPVTLGHGDDVDAPAWLVCIFSSASAPRVTLFWFAVPPATAGAASAVFHHQTTRLSWDNEAARGRRQVGDKEPYRPPPPRIRSLSLLARPSLFRQEPKFAQLLVLDATLGLRSALCAAYSSAPSSAAPGGSRGNLRVWGAAADEEAARGSAAKRKRILRSIRDSFVVRDDYSGFFEVDDGSRPHAKQEAGGPAAATGGPAAARPGFHTLNLSPVVSIVMERMTTKVAAARAPSPQMGGLEGGGASNVSGAFAAIGRVVRTGVEQGHLPLRTLLEATGNTTGSVNTDVVQSRWTDELGQLRELTDDILKVNDLAVGSYTTDASSLLERLLRLWPPAPEGLPEGLLQPEAAAFRERLVGFVAMEIFLAQFGVSVGPPSSSFKQEQSASATSGPGISSSLQTTGLPSPTTTPASSRASSAVPQQHPPSSSAEKPRDKDKGKGRALAQHDKDNEQQQQPQDDVALRLGRYAASIGPVPRRPGGPGAETVLLSVWPAEPGADPADFEWSWEPSARLAARRARQARHQRRLERRAALGLSADPDSADQQSDAAGRPHRRIGSSQPAAAAAAIRTGGGGGGGKRAQTQVAAGGVALSSQVAPTQASQAGGRAAMIMSQPVGGRHGARPGGGKKKKGDKSGFR
ncbi:hypothetical protein RB601_000317 [Gaeumannomyces tritici]